MRTPTIRYAPLLKVADKGAAASLEDALLAEVGDDAGLYDLVGAAAEYRQEVGDALAPFGLLLSGNDVCGPDPKPDWWLNLEHPRFQELAEAVTAVELEGILNRHRVTTAAETLNSKLVRVSGQYARLWARLGDYEERAYGSEPDRELTEQQQDRAQQRIYAAADALAAAFDEHPRALVRMWAEQAPSPQLLMWSDKGDGLKVETLRAALTWASGRIINVYEINTGTEDIAVVISAVVLTDAEVVAMWDAAGSVGWADADIKRVAADLTTARVVRASDLAATHRAQTDVTNQ